jgi:hypothetical protein
MKWDEEYDVFGKNETHEYYNILQYSSFLVNNAMKQHKSPVTIAGLSLLTLPQVQAFSQR